MSALVSRSSLMFALGVLTVTAVACSQVEQGNDQHLSQANDYFFAGQYDRAEAEYGVVLRTAPTDPIALSRLGIMYFEQGRLVTALPALKKAAETQPENTEVQLKLGMAYLWIHAFSEAREAAIRVLKKQPDGEDAMLLLADTAVTREDSDETIKLIDSLRERDSDRLSYHLALGLVALQQKDQAGAETEFEAARAFDPN